MRPALAVCIAISVPLVAQEQVWTCPMHPEVHEHAPGHCPICGMDLVAEKQAGPLIPNSRLGSGTSWQPEESTMHMVHLQLGGFSLMVHGAGTLGWDWQAGPRGDRRGVSTNWLMVMAAHPLFGGDLMLRTMFSLEPATIPGPGFPQLGQTGEFYDGVHLHDRQHPHEFFMEVALDFRRPLSSWLGFELYGGPSGEPALGPVAFMHRASAQDDPFPPISHHWQDSSHISFGVVTAGLYTRDLKLEGSWFNGREPDQDRWDFDLRPLDSFSVRLSAAPDPQVAVQVSYGHLASPEPPQTNVVLEGESRVTASVQVSAGGVDAAAIWGRNLELGQALDSFVLEGRVPLTAADDVFGRLERVDKTAHDLAVTGVPIYTSYTLYETVLGAAHFFPALGPLQLGAGARAALTFFPEELASLYGSRVEPGVYVYLLARAAAVHSGAH